MINPKTIIQNKAQTLADNFSDPLENVNATEIYGDMKNVSKNVFDSSGAISVLKDGVTKIDTTALRQDIADLAQKIPALADIEDVSAIFPPGLNNFANGAGAAFSSKAEALVEQIVPIETALSVDEINSAVNNALDSVDNGIINSVEAEIEQFQEIYTESVRGSKSTPEPEPKAPGVTIKNPLRLFNSVNCIFTLGVLTADSANNPTETYITNGADFTILRSGGGGIDEKRIQSIYDKVGDEKGNTEYFIDDFEMSSILASNNKTGATQAINFSFSVKEPYSMGVFLQSLQAAAFDAGFENYLQAPYLLELDFVGWNDEGGKPVAYSNRKIPFKLIQIEFDVESGGSTYQVQCIPWNEQTFSQDVQELQDTISITGPDMVGILSTGEQSLSTVLNDKLQEIAKKTCQPATDFYLVRFPTQRTGDIQKSYLRKAEFTNQATVSDAEARGSRKGEQVADVAEGLTAFFKNIGLDTSSSALLQTLKGDALQNLNIIGASPMISDFKEGGDNPFGLGLYAYDKEKNVYMRNGVELTMSDNLRTFKFTQGTPITKVIEELVLVSEYGRTALNRVDKKGEIDWFRIESKCYIVSDREFESVTGDTAKIYVFDVVPYKVDASRFSAPNQANAGLIEKAKHSVKTYNYIYSGQNEDVLGFDIKFNAAFFQAIRMDMGQLSASQVVNDREKTVTTPADPAIGKPREGNTLPEGRTRSVMKAGNFNGGSYNKQYGEELAKMFHNALINSKVDLITAELEIWGDPYFIPDSGVGNFTAPRGGSKNITATGSIDHQRNEIDIVVNFRTPVDYNNDGTMLFPGATVAVDSFSGVYQVIQVTSRISNNRFTQNLELVRRRNQSTEGISKAKALVEQPGCEGVNSADKDFDGEIIGSDPNENTTNQNNEIVSPYGSNGELATIRSKNGKTTQVAKLYQAQFQALIDELENDLGYEVRTLGGYVQRSSRGSNRPSYHASGLAIDINAAENPMVRPRPDDAPEPTDMPEGGKGSVIGALAAKHGLGWGGDWNSATDAMHFSAAKSEGGSLDWPRNGLVPGGAPVEETTSQNNQTDSTKEPEQKDTTTSVANVKPRPSGQMGRSWDRNFGSTHNRDGTPKLDYVKALSSANSSVSGTTSLTAQQDFQSGQFGESTLRPYFPTEAKDDLYDVRTGDKVKAIANFYTNQGVETSKPVLRTASGVTYNEFGDPVNTGTAV